jgi:hypothetical protein
VDAVNGIQQLRRKNPLVSAQCQPDDIDVVVLDRTLHRRAPPPAPDIQQRHTPLQVQLTDLEARCRTSALRIYGALHRLAGYLVELLAEVLRPRDSAAASVGLLVEISMELHELDTVAQCLQTHLCACIFGHACALRLAGYRAWSFRKIECAVGRHLHAVRTGLASTALGNA